MFQRDCDFSTLRLFSWWWLVPSIERDLWPTSAAAQQTSANPSAETPCAVPPLVHHRVSGPPPPTLHHHRRHSLRCGADAGHSGWVAECDAGRHHVLEIQEWSGRAAERPGWQSDQSALRTRQAGCDRRPGDGVAHLRCIQKVQRSGKLAFVLRNIYAFSGQIDQRPKRYDRV